MEVDEPQGVTASAAGDAPEDKALQRPSSRPNEVSESRERDRGRSAAGDRSQSERQSALRSQQRVTSARLSQPSRFRPGVTESQRIGSAKQSGIMNSYQWKGWN